MLRLYRAVENASEYKQDGIPHQGLLSIPVCSYGNLQMPILLWNSLLPSLYKFGILLQL
jgi:hypothetical protein